MQIRSSATVRSAVLATSASILVGCGTVTPRPDLAAVDWATPSAEAVAASAPPQDMRMGRTLGVQDLVVQGAIGASFVDDLKFSQASSEDPGAVATADLSTTPLFAVFFQRPFVGETVQFGFEGGILFSWWRDSTTVRAVGNGAVLVKVDTSLFFTDLSMGPYVSTMLGRKVRLYGGVGPLLLFGDVDVESDEGDTRESTFGVGGYARGGVEFAIGGDGFVGLGVRGIVSDLEFDDLPDVSLNGVQVMATFTQRF